MAGTLRLVNTGGSNGQTTVTAAGTADRTINLPDEGGTLLINSGTTEHVLPSGTVGSPGLAIVDDLDTGIYSPEANTIAITTSGTQRLEVDAAGNVGIGTSSPSYLLDIDATTSASALQLNSNNATYGVSSNYKYNGTSIGSIGSAKGIDSTLALTDLGMNSVGNIDFCTNYTRRVRIDSSGNVGVGTTSPSSIFTVQTSAGKFEVQESGSASVNVGTLTGTQAMRLVGAGAVLFASNTSSEHARFDNSGRLLVGTSSASASFSTLLQNASGDSFGILGLAANTATPADNSVLGDIRWSDSGHTLAAMIRCKRDGGTWSGSSKPTRLEFSTTADGASSPTERMRIMSTGEILVGTSSNWFNRQFVVENTDNAAAFLNSTSTEYPVSILNSTTSGDSLFVGFWTEGRGTPVQRGFIDYNRSAGQVRYNVTSDQRLKSEIQPAPSAVNLLLSIQVRSYKWTETGHQINYGFIAQELNQPVPDAVKEGDDGDEVVDAWSVDNTKLIPLLTKALQEALTEISTLKDRLTALESA